MTDENAIRRRAHTLWELAGCPEGKHAEHWEQARREIEAEAADPVITPTEADEVR